MKIPKNPEKFPKNPGIKNIGKSRPETYRDPGIWQNPVSKNPGIEILDPVMAWSWHNHDHDHDTISIVSSVYPIFPCLPLFTLSPWRILQRLWLVTTILQKVINILHALSRGFCASSLEKTAQERIWVTPETPVIRRHDLKNKNTKTNTSKENLQNLILDKWPVRHSISDGETNDQQRQIQRQWRGQIHYEMTSPAKRQIHLENNKDKWHWSNLDAFDMTWPTIGQWHVQRQIQIPSQRYMYTCIQHGLLACMRLLTT